MKHFLLASLLLLVAADANAQEGGRVSYFRTIIVQGPGTVPGDLTCIFCSVVVARGGVGGNVVTIGGDIDRSEEHTSELQSRLHLVCRLLLEKKKKIYIMQV